LAVRLPMAGMSTGGGVAQESQTIDNLIEKPLQVDTWHVRLLRVDLTKYLLPDGESLGHLPRSRSSGLATFMPARAPARKRMLKTSVPLSANLSNNLPIGSTGSLTELPMLSSTYLGGRMVAESRRRVLTQLQGTEF
jgi:hypothetical protein